MSVRVWKRDPNAVLSRLQAWAQQLGEDPRVLAVVLFGSLARGEATAASDADVLIVLRDSVEEFGERMVRYKPVGLGVSVEVFPYTLDEARRALRDGRGVIGVALREGRVLLPRGRGQEAVGELLNAPA
ncbi:MAG: nucleotidyltransferase domain-containing protein [Armatimonadetes bacterium]|nr:nucleotidyltransferase domain-containing protein [Armatimonadota bacterium]